MAPYELKNLTVRRLGEIRNAMLTLEYMWEFQKLPPEKQHEGGLYLHRVQMAFIVMRAAELNSIRDQLVALEAELIDGANAVQQVLGDLKKTENIMAVVAGFLNITGRILSLL